MLTTRRSAMNFGVGGKFLLARFAMCVVIRTFVRKYNISMKEEIKLDTPMVECVQDLNTNNVWQMDEFEVAAMWERDRKEEDFSNCEEKLLNILRLAFEVVHYNVNDSREVARYESGEWATFVRCNSKKGHVALRKKSIGSLSDLSYENIKHITAATLLELINRNFGGGWDSISLAMKDIIETGFDISTTQLPASRLHMEGGTLDRKVAQGYDVLEIAKGTWIEAIFAKKKDPVEKLKQSKKRDSYKDIDNDREEDDDSDLPEEEDSRDEDEDEDEDEEQNDDTFYSSYSPEAAVKQEDEEGFPMEE